jgi:hypothetical protein
MSKNDVERLLRFLTGAVFFGLLVNIGATSTTRDDSNFNFRSVPLTDWYNGDHFPVRKGSIDSLRVSSHELAGQLIPYPAKFADQDVREPLEIIRVMARKIPGKTDLDAVDTPSEEPTPKSELLAPRPPTLGQ